MKKLLILLLFLYSISANADNKLSAATTNTIPTHSKEKVWDPQITCQGQAAYAFVVDKSGSSIGNIDLYKEILREQFQTLPNGTPVSLVAFDYLPLTILSPQKINNSSREMMIKRMNQFFPYGKSSPLAAIKLSGEYLSKIKADCYHLIILTDGMISDLVTPYLELIKSLNNKGIITSVCILEDKPPSDIFEQLAKEGKGFFLRTNMKKFGAMCGKKIKGLAQ